MTDLKTISGIGPAMEKKLHDLGIANIDALAGQDDAATLAELIGARGIDAERVQSWIDLARSGSTAPVAPAPQANAAPAEVAEAPEPAPSSAPAKAMSLHELNMQARKIDRQHAKEREEARVAAQEAAQAKLKTASMRTPRRLQKNLRPSVYRGV